MILCDTIYIFTARKYQDFADDPAYILLNLTVTIIHSPIIVQYCFLKFLVLGSRACLAVRFTAKNGDHAEAGKI